MDWQLMLSAVLNLIGIALDKIDKPFEPLVLAMFVRNYRFDTILALAEQAGG